VGLDDVGAHSLCSGEYRVKRLFCLGVGSWVPSRHPHAREWERMTTREDRRVPVQSGDSTGLVPKNSPFEAVAISYPSIKWDWLATVGPSIGVGAGVWGLVASAVTDGSWG
jgi:hypothetical protein